VDPAAPDQTTPLIDVPRPAGLGTLLRGIGDLIRLDGLDGRGVLLPDIAQRFIGLATEPTTLSGGDAPDILLPGDGDDLIAGGAADDLLAGGRGNDTLIANGGSNVLIGGEGRDAFVILATASSSAVQVVTDLRVENDTLVLSGFGGRKAALDAIGIAPLPGGVALSMPDGQTVVLRGLDERALLADGLMRFETGAQTFSSIPPDGTWRLSDGDDQYVFRGEQGAGIALDASAGADTVSGSAGDDTIDGGPGRDRLSGGAGADLFVFDSADLPIGSEPEDTILDFALAEDRLEFRGFGDQGRPGAISVTAADGGVDVRIGDRAPIRLDGIEAPEAIRDDMVLFT
jgi:Ca2+-binding RTX toxin-like protein